MKGLFSLGEPGAKGSRFELVRLLITRALLLLVQTLC